MAFQKATKCYSVFSFYNVILLLFKSKSKTIMQYTWLKQLKKNETCIVSLSVDWLSTVAE